MAFLLYFVVILVSAAAVMFGLDLATSPLPSTPNVPIGRVAHVTPPSPAQRTARATRADEAAARAADDSKLSPVYPANPKVPKAQLAQQPTGSAAPKQAPNDTWLPPAPQQQATGAPPQNQQAPTSSQPQSQQAASGQPDSSQPPAATAQSAAAQAPAQCDVQACSAAYRSFRASDCSYQPYHGPRRACTKSGATVAAAAPRHRRQASRSAHPYYGRPQPYYGPRDYGARDEELAHIVRRMTRGERGPIAVQDSEGRIIIVHPGRARAYSPFDDDDYGD